MSIDLYPFGIKAALAATRLAEATAFFADAGINAAEVELVHVTAAARKMDWSHWEGVPHPCVNVKRSFAGVLGEGFTLTSVAKIARVHDMPLKLAADGCLMATDGVQYAAFGGYCFLRFLAGGVWEVFAEHTASKKHTPAADVAAALAAVRQWEPVTTGTVSPPFTHKVKVDLLGEGWVGRWSGAGYATKKASQDIAVSFDALGSRAVVETVIKCTYRSMSCAAPPPERHIKLEGELSFLYQTLEGKALMCFGV